jgi:glutathione S-transferase
MTLALYAHPFSSYCQKALTALYENDTPFEMKMLGPETPDNFAEFASLWPLQRMPLLVDNGQSIMEASIIIEHLALHHPGPVRLLPAEPGAALEIRFLDRFFDNYVMTPMQRIVADYMRAPEDRDAITVAEARTLLDTAYTWLDRRMEGRYWASGDDFSMADCAAALSLFYADWVQSTSERFANVHAYRNRLLSRPSFARAVDEAREFRPLFPPGAPDRD